MDSISFPCDRFFIRVFTRNSGTDNFVLIRKYKRNMTLLFILMTKLWCDKIFFPIFLNSFWIIQTSLILIILSKKHSVLLFLSVVNYSIKLSIISQPVEYKVTLEYANLFIVFLWKNIAAKGSLKLPVNLKVTGQCKFRTRCFCCLTKFFSPLYFHEGSM